MNYFERGCAKLIVNIVFKYSVQWQNFSFKHILTLILYSLHYIEVVWQFPVVISSHQIQILNVFFPPCESREFHQYKSQPHLDIFIKKGIYYNDGIIISKYQLLKKIEL